MTKKSFQNVLGLFILHVVWGWSTFHASIIKVNHSKWRVDSLWLNYCQVTTLNSEKNESSSCLQHIDSFCMVYRSWKQPQWIICTSKTICVVSSYRPSRALQLLQRQTPSALRLPQSLPKRLSQPTPSPLSLLPLLLLIPLATLWLNPRPQWPVSLPPSPPRVQLVSWSTLMRISRW